MGMCQELRKRIESGEGLVAPLCYDALSARLVERLGFGATYLGGGSLGAVLNVTEAMLTVTELATAMHQITLRTRIPVIADGTTGFGEPLHVMRTVREVERAGGAGIEIEDQLVPKRAHHHRGIEHLIPVEAMADKVRAAVEAREDPDFVIIARTNGVMQESFERAVERGRAYAEAGADLIMATPRTLDEAKRLPQEIGAPMMLMVSPTDGEANLPPAELARMGYPLIVHPTAGLVAAFGALWDTYRDLKEHGRLHLDPGRVEAVQAEINEAVHLPEYWRLEEETVEKD